MKNRYLKGKNNFPEVNLCVEKGVFEISGHSYGDRVLEEVYKDVFQWVEEQMPKIENSINCIFSLNIINSISFKCIVKIMMEFEESCKKGKDINVIWNHESDDEENEELAEDLSNMFNVPFQINAI